jgi:hypothetical protein
MTVSITVGVDCSVGGYAVSISFSSAVPAGSTWTLYRQTDDGLGRSPVRGARNISVGSTSIASVIDYEAPISETMVYEVVVSGYGGAAAFAPSIMDTCGVGQYLRDLLDPDVHYTSQFCLGEIDSVESNVRSGVFTVLGRPAPIVVVDARETETGTLRFIARNQQEINALKNIFKRGTPMLLQLDKRYNLGNEGVLYFQPSKFVTRWVSPNARIAQQVIEVQFTTVDAPSYTTIFVRYGLPYNVPVTASPGFLITSGELQGRRYCQGGLLQRYGSYDALSSSGRTYAEAYYTPDVCSS